MGFPTWVHVPLLQIPYQSNLDYYYETHIVSHIIEKKCLSRAINSHFGAPTGVLVIWGEKLFIFRELGSTGNYFQGFWEQADSFGDLGSPAK